MGGVVLQVVEHHRQHPSAHGGLGAELPGGGAVEQLVGAGKGHGVRRPARGGHVGKGAAVVHDLQLSGTVQGDGHSAVIRHGLPYNFPCAVLPYQHRHGAGGGAGRGHSEGHAAGNILHGFSSRRHSQLHRVPRLLGGDGDGAARAGQAAQAPVGDGHVGHGGGYRQAGVCLAPELPHGGGRDGHLRFGHAPGDLGGDHHILALVGHGLFYDLLAHGGVDGGGGCAALSAGCGGGGGCGGHVGAALPGGGDGEGGAAGGAGAGGHIGAAPACALYPRRNFARQGGVVGRVGGGKDPLIGGVGRHFRGVGQGPGHGARRFQIAPLGGQSHIRQGLAAGGDGGVLGRARGSGLVDGHNNGARGLGVVVLVGGHEFDGLGAAVRHVGQRLILRKAPCAGDVFPVNRGGALNCGIGNGLAGVGDGDGVRRQGGHEFVCNGDGDGQVKSVVIGGAGHGNGDRAGLPLLLTVIHQLIGQHRAVHRGFALKNAVIICFGGRIQHIASREQVG